VFLLNVEQEHNRGQLGSDLGPPVASTINTFLATGAFRGLATRQITTGFSPIARAETEAAGKLDHQLTKNTALMLRYVFTNNKEASDAFNTDGLIDASARGSRFTSDNAVSGSLTTVLGSEAVRDLRFQAATRDAVLRTNEPFGPEIDIAGLVTFGRPYAGNSERRENHYQASYAYSRTRGKHLWKVGGTVNRVSLRADVPDGFEGVYLFGSLGDFLAGNPNQFRRAFGNPNVDFPVTSIGGFVQDHWSLTRQLTVDLGIRYDFERLPAGFNQDTNNVSPRIGLAWSPFSKWVFRGGYGVFFDRYVLANLTRAIEKNGSQAFEQVADGNAAASLFATAEGGLLVTPASAIAPSIFRADPRPATPYSQQASASAEYLIAANLTVRADYMFVRGLKLPRTLNVNLLPPVVLTLANAPSLGVPNPMPQQIGREVFPPGRLDTQFGDIYEARSSQQLNWRIDRRHSQRSGSVRTCPSASIEPRSRVDRVKCGTSAWSKQSRGCSQHGELWSQSTQHVSVNHGVECLRREREITGTRVDRPCPITQTLALAALTGQGESLCGDVSHHHRAPCCRRKVQAGPSPPGPYIKKQ
jgi:hypothetical protein